MATDDRWYVSGSLGVGTAFDEPWDPQSVPWDRVGSAIRHSGSEILNLLDSRPAAPGQGPYLNWWGLTAAPSNKAVRLGAISSRFASTAEGGSSAFMSFGTKAANGDVTEALRITPQQTVSVPNTLSVGPATAGPAVGRLEVSGPSGEVSFLRRSLSAWPSAPVPGDRFLWYNPDGSARLWTERDVLTISANGEMTLTGPLTIPSVLQWGSGATRKGWLGYSGGLSDTALTISNDRGRMHIAGAELLYVLNKSGVIIGREWGGNGNLTVQGDTALGGDVTWGLSRLSRDQGGSIELGGQNPFVVNNAPNTPYIDFHYKGQIQDYSTRIINNDEGCLTLQVPRYVRVLGGFVVEGQINDTMARDLLNRVGPFSVMIGVEPPMNSNVVFYWKDAYGNKKKGWVSGSAF